VRAIEEDAGGDCLVKILAAKGVRGNDESILRVLSNIVEESAPNLITFGGINFDLPDISQAGWINGRPALWLERYLMPHPLSGGGSRQVDPAHYDMLRLVPSGTVPRREEVDALLREALLKSGVRLFVGVVDGVRSEVINAGYVMAMYLFWRRKTGCMSLEAQRQALTQLRREISR
jgi:hypothetical protein